MHDVNISGGMKRTAIGFDAQCDMRSIKLEKLQNNVWKVLYNNAEGTPTVERDIPGGVKCCRWDEMFSVK